MAVAGHLPQSRRTPDGGNAGGARAGKGHYYFGLHHSGPGPFGRGHDYRSYCLCRRRPHASCAHHFGHPLYRRGSDLLSEAGQYEAGLGTAVRHARTIGKGPRMFRKDTSLSPLQTRKKLLLAESEVNRAELVRELHKVKDEISHIKEQVRT